MNTKWNIFALIFSASLATAQVPEVATPADTAVANAVTAWRAEGVSQLAYIRGGSVGFGRGYHELHVGFDFTNCYGVRLQGDANTHLYDTTPGIAVNLTGSYGAKISDMKIEARGGGTAMLLARRQPFTYQGKQLGLESAGTHHFEHVDFDGPVVIEASEANTFVNCRFYGRDARPALTIRNGAPSTMQTQTFVGCWFTNQFGGPALLIDNDQPAILTDLWFHGCQASVSNAAECAVEMRSRGAWLKMISFVGFRSEGTPRNAFLLTGTTNVDGLVIRDAATHQREAMLKSKLVPGRAIYKSEFTGIECWPADGATREPIYAIEAQLVDSDVRLRNSRGYAADVRP